MNLRFGPGQLRVRVDRKEAEAVVRGERVAQEIAFPGGETFRYALLASAEADPPTAALSGTTVSITVGAQAVRALLGQRPSKELGLTAKLRSPDGGVLELRLEIDLFSDGKGPRRK